MIVAGPDGLMKNAYRKFTIRGVAAVQPASARFSPGPSLTLPRVRGREGWGRSRMRARPCAGGDDYAMMREVLQRRFARALKEDPEREQGSWPDLVLIDGGLGQLNVAQGVLDELGIADVAIVGIAKGPDRNAGRERFFMPGRPPFSLDPRDPVLYFLQRLRDEAHRFAIGTHRARRTKAIGRSPLDEIAGIGARRKQALLHHFGSARAVARAGLGELERVGGISKTVAKKIYDHFHADELRCPTSLLAHRERRVPLTSLPNLLTLSRILAIPVVVATFYVPGDYARWFACALFSAAGVTDWLDGHMARRWQQQSEIGRFLDPIADKLLVSATLFMLTTFGRLSAAAVLPALVILCREILVSGLREYLAGLRVGVPVSRLAKWKTAIQMVAIGFLIVGDAGPGVLPVAGDRRELAVDRSGADPGHRLRLSAGGTSAYHAAPAAPVRSAAANPRRRHRRALPRPSSAPK